MITLENLEKWLNAPAEIERLEFKEAKQQYDTTKLLRYCVALANEGGGYLVLGVTDKPPRRVVGSQAFASLTDLNDIKARIVEKLRFCPLSSTAKSLYRGSCARRSKNVPGTGFTRTHC
ncbi:MAG: ATP-binding protein [Nostoc sp.]